MHFNIYLDDDTGQRLTAVAKDRGENRNAVIRRVLQEWLQRQGRPQWPPLVLSHTGDAEMPPFETGRDQLIPPAEDPFA